jgi:thymidylate synthase (FAD)
MIFLTKPAVVLLDTMGTDLTVVNAARVSFDKESEWETSTQGPSYGVVYGLSQKDVKLIDYLAKHNHWTPFGHITAQFRINAPIYVARQLVKHQVGLVWNEVSRRYVDSEPEFYKPEDWRSKAENVKQGSGGKLDNQRYCNSEFDDAMGASYEAYKNLIRIGVAPEQARMVLPLNTATEWYWTGSVAAFSRVCKLRLDPHTQQETREVAQQIDSALAEVFPVSWKALRNV